MVNRNIVWRLCVAVALTMGLTQSAATSSLGERTTYITFSQPVQLPGVELRAGTYIFERAEPLGAPSIVRVLSRDRAIPYYLGFTNFAERPSGTAANAVVSFGESRIGEPAPVTAWWPSGELRGHQFIYLAHRRH
jgi:hypothetical protein